MFQNIVTSLLKLPKLYFQFPFIFRFGSCPCGCAWNKWCVVWKCGNFNTKFRYATWLFQAPPASVAGWYFFWGGTFGWICLPNHLHFIEPSSNIVGEIRCPPEIVCMSFEDPHTSKWDFFGKEAPLPKQNSHWYVEVAAIGFSDQCFSLKLCSPDKNCKNMF